MHDHAIVIVLAIVVVTSIVATYLAFNAPRPAIVYRWLFFALTSLEVLLCAAIILSSLDQLPTIGSVSKEFVIAALAGVLIVVALLAWRVGTWWARHIEQDNKDLAAKLKETQSKLTLSVAAHSEPLVKR